MIKRTALALRHGNLDGRGPGERRVDRAALHELLGHDRGLFIVDALGRHVDAQRLDTGIYGLTGNAARVEVGFSDGGERGQRDVHLLRYTLETEAAGSLATVQEYEEALHRAGFRVVRNSDRRDFALDFFEATCDATEGAEAPLHGMRVLMGANAGIKVKNVLENLVAGVIAPVEIIALSRKLSELPIFQSRLHPGRNCRT